MTTGKTLTPAQAAKAWRAKILRTVPIGGVFLIATPAQGDEEPTRSPTLYKRISESRVACFVDSVGNTHNTDETSTRIGSDWFVNEAAVILLDEDDQARRIMLAVHGQGAKALSIPQRTTVSHATGGQDG